jgi:hypothetical protein
MDKPLCEHHHDLMVEALQDDPRINYAKRIVACELLALTLGKDYICDLDFIALQMNRRDIVTA